MPCIQRDAVLHNTVGHHVLSGKQRCPRRCTGRTLCKVIAEGGAVAAQRVQVWCLDAGMLQKGNCVAAPLIDNDQQDILNFAHIGISLKAWAPEITLRGANICRIPRCIRLLIRTLLLGRLSALLRYTSPATGIRLYAYSMGNVTNCCSRRRPRPTCALSSAQGWRLWDLVKN